MIAYQPKHSNVKLFVR